MGENAVDVECKRSRGLSKEALDFSKGISIDVSIWKLGGNSKARMTFEKLLITSCHQKCFGLRDLFADSRYKFFLMEYGSISKQFQ